MRIGEAAAKSGVTRDTLRYYERRGLLPRAPRGQNGYREYPDAIVDRVRVVRSALRFGFSLDQIAAFLKARESGRPPCRQVRAAALEILEALDRQIAALSAARAHVQRTLAEWDLRLESTPDGEPARLLEAIDATRA